MATFYPHQVWLPWLPTELVALTVCFPSAPPWGMRVRVRKCPAAPSPRTRSGLDSRVLEEDTALLGIPEQNQPQASALGYLLPLPVLPPSPQPHGA